MISGCIHQTGLEGMPKGMPTGAGVLMGTCTVDDMIGAWMVVDITGGAMGAAEDMIGGAIGAADSEVGAAIGAADTEMGAWMVDDMTGADTMGIDGIIGAYDIAGATNETGAG